MFLIGEPECVSNTILHDKCVILDKNLHLANAQTIQSLILNLMPDNKSKLEWKIEQIFML